MLLFRRSDQGFAASAIIVAMLSLLLGVGAAILAVQSVVSSYQSNDRVAVQTGPVNPIDPGKVITYGG